MKVTTDLRENGTAHDASSCPLCGAPNQCAMEIERATGLPQLPCWCTQADFGAQLLDRLPASARGKVCICRTCTSAAPNGSK